MTAVNLGFVDDPLAWSQNSIVGTTPATHLVQLTSGANSDIGNLIYLGTPLGREGVLKFSASITVNVSGNMIFGFVDAASSTSIATDLAAAATFYGFASNPNNGQTVPRYAGVAGTAFANYVPNDGVMRDYWVSYEIAAGQMTIKLARDTPSNVVISYTGTAPSFTTMRPAIGATGGGSFAIVGNTQGQPYQETDPAAYLITGLTHLDYHAGADISWAQNLVALSYDWRVNGGSITNQADSAAPFVRLSGLTDGTPATFEVRTVNANGVGAWQALTINPLNTYLYDDFNRANSTTLIGSPIQGGPYTVVAGTFGISSNTVYEPVAGSPGRVTFPAAADVDISYTVPSNTQGNACGVIFRYIDASNYWTFIFATSGVYLQRYIAGAANTLYQNAVAPVAKDRLRVIVKGPMMYAYVNNILRAAIRDDWYSLATSTCGLIINNTANAFMDNLLVTDPPTDPTLGLNGMTSHAPADTEFISASSLTEPAWAYLGRDTKTADTGAA